MRIYSRAPASIGLGVQSENMERLTGPTHVEATRPLESQVESAPKRAPPAEDLHIVGDANPINQLKDAIFSPDRLAAPGFLEGALGHITKLMARTDQMKSYEADHSHALIQALKYQMQAAKRTEAYQDSEWYHARPSSVTDWARPFRAIGRLFGGGTYAHQVDQVSETTLNGHLDRLTARKALAERDEDAARAAREVPPVHVEDTRHLETALAQARAAEEDTHVAPKPEPVRAILDETGRRVQVLSSDPIKRRSIEAYGPEVNAKIFRDLRDAHELLEDIPQWVGRMQELVDEGGLAQFHGQSMTRAYHSAQIRLETAEANLRAYDAVPEYTGKKNEISGLLKEVVWLRKQLKVHEANVNSLPERALRAPSEPIVPTVVTDTDEDNER